MHRRFVVLLILLMWVGLSGCAGFGAGLELPTLIPTEYVPTVIAMTAQAMVTPTQTPAPIDNALTVEATVAVEEWPPTASLTPENLSAITPSPASPVIIPEADIQIIRPGPLSKIVSPTTLFMYVIPGAERRAQVELWGEDGHLIYRKIFTFNSINLHTSVLKDFGFETAGVAETGRLVVQTQDDYGRVMALASVDLILLAEGEADINLAHDVLAPIVIQQPEAEVLIQGGTLTVSGLVRTTGEQPLLVELIATDGRVVGSRLAGVTPTQTGEHHPFSVEIPYQVDAPTWVRVTISARGGSQPGPINIKTVEILLSP